MPTRREPIELIEAKGRKHLSKAEIEERKAKEVKAPTAKRVRVPAWLPEGLVKEYRSIARQLIALDIFSDLDMDTLARYLMAQESYLQASGHMADALSEGDAEKVAEWSGVQDRFFKQAMASARELGLTISSRCKLIIPKVEAPDTDERDADLFGD